MKEIRIIIFAICFIPIVLISSIFAAPFYAMCVMAGEKDVLNQMMDRVGEWLALKCREFAEGKTEHVSSL